MKTAVSLPDELFERAERLAERTGKSRSQIYREALAEYLARREVSSVTEAIDRVVDEVGDEHDPWVRASARRLERVEW